jgi:single-strand selective monofunctional uracil DNA glycosylase
VVDGLLDAGERLSRRLAALRLPAPVTHVYDPTTYARETYRAFVRLQARSPKRALFLGMNPGPHGMVQTGVPFGEVAAVRDWMGIDAPVGRPRREHGKRPVLGFACRRSEVSGRRLWGLFAGRFGSAEAFFADHAVLNYCPLALFDADGRNVTPDRLAADARARLEAACDEHLAAWIRALSPAYLVGVGAYAEACLSRVLDSVDPVPRPRLGRIPHPSPASPAANRDWAGGATRALQSLGAW